LRLSIAWAFSLQQGLVSSFEKAGDPKIQNYATRINLYASSARSQGPGAKCQQPGALPAIALLALMLLALSGCASVGPAVSPAAAPWKAMVKAPENGWWYARFSIRWPEGKGPSWSVDPLLAHLVISPVLSRHGNEIVLYRFHRRSARDQAGHQFSFIFYATQETAREIFLVLQSDAGLKALKDRGVIVSDAYDDTSVITRPNIEDTSDRIWSPAIRKSWPFYIMGVSEMWLNLIVEVASQTSGGKTPVTVDEQLRFYEQVNASIEQMWKDEGQHAFLHHLNAIFGYEPLTVREKRLMSF
jgi:hypothetical protein